MKRACSSQVLGDPEIATEEHTPEQDNSSRFREIPVAPDGRCYFRCDEAACDLWAYCAVPRDPYSCQPLSNAIAQIELLAAKAERS